jgi:hypothetical protein
VVTVIETGARLPSADVLVVGSGQATFGGGDGVFVIRRVPVGEQQVRVRRVGFTPVTATVTVRAGETDTLRVALPLLAIRLSQVRVSDNSCGKPRAGDSLVAMIYQQVQQNAERAQLFAEEYPFEMAMERVYTTQYASLRNGRRADTLRVDTAYVAGEHDWKYAPGKIIQPIEGGVGGAREKMTVLQLSDFADAAFIGAHCYRYAGVERMDGTRMIRVNFAPARGVPEPDVRGALYLDTATFEIRHSVVEVERVAPGARSVVTVVTRVDTWFRSLAAGHNVIDRVTQRTTAMADGPMGGAFDVPGEFHRLLEVRFTTDRRPDRPPMWAAGSP